MERLGDDVGRALERLGPGGRIGELTEAWPAAVGEAVARNAWPARVGRDGTLHVAVSSSAWAFELAQLAPTILERLRGALGASAPPAVRFAPGPLPAPPTAASTRSGDRSAGSDPTPEERRIAAELAAGVADDDLRALIARAAAASLARAAASSSQRTVPTGSSATLSRPAIG
jgi:hypothetical protein